MIMDTKKEYTAPELTVVTFKTERGYASSTNRLTDLLFGGPLFDGQSSGNTEAWDYNENDRTFGNIGWQ